MAVSISVPVEALGGDGARGCTSLEEEGRGGVFVERSANCQLVVAIILALDSFMVSTAVWLTAELNAIDVDCISPESLSVVLACVKSVLDVDSER